MTQHNTQHNTRHDANVAAISQLGKATVEQNWLAVTFKIEPGGRLTVDMTTWEFPKDKMLGCLELLRGMIEKESRVVEPEIEPLPLAPHLTVAGSQDEEEPNGSD